jgi:hypothetical protein
VDKRATERLPILGELEGSVAVHQPIGITSISEGGAEIDAAVPLQIDSIHQFRLLLGEQPIVVTGRVAHCRVVDVGQDTMCYRAGIEFVDPTNAARAAIAAFIAVTKSARRML